MERVPIAELAPSLPSTDTKAIKAVVTLIWPYSSSTKQAALLLAEPDFRLRRRKGQVRVQLAGASAEAVARSHISIGDEVTLRLLGAQWMSNVENIKTPGRSVEWELQYGQRLIMQITREGHGLADLDVDEPAASVEAESETQAPEEVSTSPRPHVPEHTTTNNSTAIVYSSPAILKQVRLSGNSLFESLRDVFMSEEGYVEGRERKRRRKSWKDVNVWTYSERTPSPEKDGIDAMLADNVDSLLPEEEILQEVNGDAMHGEEMEVDEQPVQLPRSPVSTEDVTLGDQQSATEFPDEAAVNVQDGEVLKADGDVNIEHVNAESVKDRSHVSVERESTKGAQSRAFNYDQGEVLEQEVPHQRKTSTQSSLVQEEDVPAEESEADASLDDQSDSSESDTEVEIVATADNSELDIEDEDMSGLADYGTSGTDLETEYVSEYEEESEYTTSQQDPSADATDTNVSEEDGPDSRATIIDLTTAAEDDESISESGSQNDVDDATGSTDGKEALEEEDDMRDGATTGKQATTTSEPAPLMPPPSLSLLQTAAAALEQASSEDQERPNQQDAPLTPVLHPVISATLPLPSPFPADADAMVNSYMDPSLRSRAALMPPLAQTRSNDRPSGTSPRRNRRFSRESRASHTSSRSLEMEDAFSGRFSAQFPFGLDGTMLSRQEDPALKSPFENAPAWLAKQHRSSESHPEVLIKDQRQPGDQPLTSATVEEQAVDDGKEATPPSGAPEPRSHAQGPVIIDLPSQNLGPGEAEDGCQQDMPIDEVEVSHETFASQPDIELSQDLTERYGVTTGTWTPSSPSVAPQEPKELQQREDAAIDTARPTSNVIQTEIIDLGSESDQEDEDQASVAVESPTTASRGREEPDTQPTDVPDVDTGNSHKGYSGPDIALQGRSSALKAASHLWEVIKDSEEGSVRSASSMSTVQDSETAEGEQMDVDEILIVQPAREEEPLQMHTTDSGSLYPEIPTEPKPDADILLAARSREGDGSLEAPPAIVESVDGEVFYPDLTRDLQQDDSVHATTSHLEPVQADHMDMNTAFIATGTAITEVVTTEQPDLPGQVPTNLQPDTSVRAPVFGAVAIELEDFHDSTQTTRDRETPQYLSPGEEGHLRDITIPSSFMDVTDRELPATDLAQTEDLPGRSADALQMVSLPQVLEGNTDTAEDKKIYDDVEVARDRQLSPPHGSENLNEVVELQESTRIALEHLIASASPPKTIAEGHPLGGDVHLPAAINNTTFTQPPAADSLQTPTVSFSSIKQFESFDQPQTGLDDSNQLLTPDPSQQLLGETSAQHTLDSANSVLPLTPQPTQASFSSVLPVAPSSPIMAKEALKEDELPKKKRKSARLSSSTIPDVLSPWFAPRSSEAAAASLESQSELDSELESEVEASSIPDEPANDAITSSNLLSTVRAHLDRHLALPPTTLHPAAVHDTISSAQPRSSPPSSVITALQSQLQTQKQPTTTTTSSSQGLRTPLSYYTPLTHLSSHLNTQPPSTVDILAVVSRATKPPERAAAGPRDYYTVFSVTDPAAWPARTQVQVFRPWKAAVPVAQVGDVVLLRGFVVKSRKGVPGLLSGEESGWCVWRFDGGEGGREEVKGPPVEIGREERLEANGLRDWWKGGGSAENDGDEVKDFGDQENGSLMG